MRPAASRQHPSRHCGTCSAGRAAVPQPGCPLAAAADVSPAQSPAQGFAPHPATCHSRRAADDLLTLTALGRPERLLDTTVIESTSIYRRSTASRLTRHAGGGEGRRPHAGHDPGRGAGQQLRRPLVRHCGAGHCQASEPVLVPKQVDAEAEQLHALTALTSGGFEPVYRSCIKGIPARGTGSARDGDFAVAAGGPVPGPEDARTRPAALWPAWQWQNDACQGGLAGP